MSKKIRKQNKKQSAGGRRYQRIRGFIDNVAYAKANESNICAIDISGKPVIKQPSELLRHAFNDIAHRWSVLLAVSCTERNGKIKLSTDEFRLPGKFKRDDLESGLIERHLDLLELCSENKDVRYLGWIASANGKQFDIEEISELFELMREREQ